MIVTQADRLRLECKQNEVHGMAQRGGSVLCHVRLSSNVISSDIIQKGALIPNTRHRTDGGDPLLGISLFKWNNRQQQAG